MIRQAQIEDISHIAEIIVFEKYQAFPTLLNDISVYDDGIIKGLINKTNYKDEIELCDFYVDPFFKGNGIGRKLIQFFINEAHLFGTYVMKKGYKELYYSG